MEAPLRRAACFRFLERQADGEHAAFAGDALDLDAPMVGLRTFDLLRVIEWLSGLRHSSIHLVGCGRGSIPATFAAVLDARADRVTLKGAPESYAQIATVEEAAWPLSALLPGVLAKFDLPDCYRVLEGRGLRRLEPSGPLRVLAEGGG